MNIFEKKLYGLVNLLSEEGEIVKNKETGNVYVVKKFDPSKHDKPTPDEVEKTKAANGGKIPTSDKSSPKPKPKPVAQQQPKAEPKKIAATDFKTDAEKSTNGDDMKLKNQVPQSEKPKFDPIPAKDVTKQMPNADPNTFEKPSEFGKEIGHDKLNKFVTDIAKVGQEINDKKARGEETKKINLCKVTIPGTNLYCEKNKGLTRVEMPQFKGTPVPGSEASKMPLNKDGEVDTEPVFRKMLQDKGIKTTQTEVPADRLKATQSELGADKVLGMVDTLEKDPTNEALTGPVFVSRDGYVIDGHHRWAAIAAHNAKHPDKQIPMKSEVIDMDIKDAIPMCNKFAKDIGIASKAQGVTTGNKAVAENKIIKLSNFLR